MVPATKPIQIRVQQYYLACLAHASYLISEGSEAAVIDPQRDVDRYLQDAARLGVTIKYVIETHLHADFVSGHQELAARTGAQIVLSHRANAKFPHRPVHDGEILWIGGAALRVIETPGHTVESICLLLESVPNALFSGDTLFIDDVGRPDLDAHFTPQELAGMLYDSLHGKLLRLGDDTVVYPAHGAGSLCGRAMSSERSSTIGEQKHNNYACRPMPKDEFIAKMTVDLPERPAYFARDVELNRAGAPALSEMKPLPALTPLAATERICQGAVVVDTRPAHQFAAGHIPGAINLGLNGQFASWAGSLIPGNATIILVCEENTKVEESRLRLARVGLDGVVGYVARGILGWQDDGRPLAEMQQITAAGLRDRFGDFNLLDVRNDAESALGGIPSALHIPLGALRARLDRVPSNKALVVYCQGGYRSAAAVSLLMAAGRSQVVNLIGGYQAWLSASAETP